MLKERSNDPMPEDRLTPSGPTQQTQGHRSKCFAFVESM